MFLPNCANDGADAAISSTASIATARNIGTTFGIGVTDYVFPRQVVLSLIGVPLHWMPVEVVDSSNKGFGPAATMSFVK